MVDDDKHNDDKTKNTSSPYYLHPSDHPGMNICQVVLKGENFQEWERCMRNAFRAKRKLGFLDGVIKKPDDESLEIEDWWSVNSMLLAWLFNSIEPNLRSSISYFDTVKELWDDLRQRFSIGNGPRIQQLTSDLARCEQNGQSISSYYGKLKKLWDELSMYVSTKGCTCGKCECNWAAELSKERDERQVHQFLMGLDDDLYGNIRTNIIAQDPLPPLNRAYALVIQEERHKNMAKGKEGRSEAVSFAVQRSSHPSSKQRNDKVVCTNCNYPGHDVSSCFQLKGYPDWWTGPRGKNSSGRGRGAASSSGRGKGVNFGVANAAQNASSNQSNTSVHLSSQDRSSLSPALNDEQWNTVINMLKSLAPNNDNQAEKLSGMSLLVWILDTGASLHMTGDKSVLHDIHDIFPIPVYLPDGVLANAVQEGTVVFNDGLRVENVLYVPRLRCNLISFIKLMKDHDYIVTSTPKICVIQDRISRTVIGVGEERNGVYWLRSVASQVGHCCSTTSDTYQTWHRRLGHPSYQLVSSFPGVLSSDCSKNKNKPCDVCFKAKQTRVSFPLSSSNASSAFELIHCDVWGPYSTPSSCGASYFLTIVDDYSRGIWVYLMGAKSEVGKIIRNFFAMASTQFHKKVKCIRSDNGTEFTCLEKFFQEQGTLFESSCVGTPQQNARVERKHRHILNVARALRFQASLPFDFWGECILTAGYLINRTPTPLNKGKTPYELLFGHSPSYNHIRIFGSLCFASKIPRDRNKFSSRSRKCIFVGYPYGKKGGDCMILKTKSFLFLVM